MGVLNLLTQPKTEAIQVDVKHIPYVETLWNRLEAARSAQASKEDYLRSASQLGVRVASLNSLANTALADGKAISGSGRTLDRIKRVLASGAEPTSPPQWPCGMIETPRKVKDANGRKVWPTETWPHGHTNGYQTWEERENAIRVFRGAVPLSALQKFATVKSDLDDVRIYSPNADDFRTLRNPRPIDPVMIGMIEFLGEKQYFEIARWDIDKDLVEIFTPTG